MEEEDRWSRAGVRTSLQGVSSGLGLLRCILLRMFEAADGGDDLGHEGDV